MDINLTLVGQMITFMVLVVVTMKYIWPPMIKALDERSKKIASGLEAAERGHHELELAQHKAAEKLREAKLEAAKIVDQATARSARMVEEAKEKARLEGDRMILVAKDQIAQEVELARQQLLKQVGSLAMSGAEKILSDKMDLSVHNRMVDQLIDELR